MEWIIISELVSIIVPVYNVAEYLSRCLDSLRQQSYKAIEIILVDDGSKDNSNHICKKHAMMDDRIKVFRIKNNGVSAARNYGIEQATGKYLTFVDGDDWLHIDAIMTHVTNLEKNNSDISITGYSMVWEDGSIQKMSNEDDLFVFSKEEALKHWFAESLFKGFVWDKLFRMELVGDLRFPENQRFMEDVHFANEVFINCNKVVYSGKENYYYFQREDSVTNKPFDEHELIGLKEIEAMIKYSSDNGNIYDPEVKSRYVLLNFLLINRIYSSNNKEHFVYVPELVENIKRNKEYTDGNYINKQNKVFIKLLMLNGPRKTIVKTRNLLLKIKRRYNL